jgi:hypothetical protein
VFTACEVWAFQRNENALHFYESQGFRLIEATDGGGNEEREPDMLLTWSQ